MAQFCNRRITAVVIGMSAILLLLVMTALLVRFFAFNNERSENMVTNQQLWLRPVDSIFCNSHTISAQLDETFKTLINSPPYFDAYVLTQEEYANMNKTIIARNFTIHSLSGLQPSKFKYHNYYFMENTHVEVSACFTYVGDDGNDNASTVYMYWMKSERVFESMQQRLYTGNCSNFADDVCDVVTINLQNNCNDSDAFSTTMDFDVAEKDHYVFTYYYLNAKSDKKTQSSGILLWLNYKLQRPMYNVSHFSNIIGRKTSQINLKSKIMLLDFPYLLDKPFSEAYNIEVTFTPEPNIFIYLVIFGGFGIMLLVPFILYLIQYTSFLRRTGYEEI